MDRLVESGIELWAHGEVEFFVGRRSRDADHGESDGGYQSSAPQSFGQAVRRQAHGLLAGMGVPVKYAHAEVGRIPAEEPDSVAWEQHEIELALAPLRTAADAVVLTQWVIASVAEAYGLAWSFAPVVRAGHAGNGVHFHLSPRRDGEPLEGLRPDDGSLASEANALTGALLRFAGPLMAFGNRSELGRRAVRGGMSAEERERGPRLERIHERGFEPRLEEQVRSLGRRKGREEARPLRPLASGEDQREVAL